MDISRREFLGGVAAAGAGAMLAACARQSEARREVTLYTSVDAYVAQPVVAAYEQQSGVRVTLVTDTEATKTLGLVQRLVAERERPKCDVWWSGEALGTASLATLGLLAKFTPACIDDFGGTWPAHVSDREGRWYGVATRARVTAFSTTRVQRERVPTSPAALLTSGATLRMGMARPQFGTTRSHVAALVTLHGEAAAGAWLDAIAKRVRVYEGNSAVVQAIANAEIDVGWTDTDDVWAGQANGWAVDCVFDGQDDAAMGGRGPIVMPCTVGVIAGSAREMEALAIASFLLSAQAERLMSQTESRNVPVRSGLAAELAKADARLRFPPAAVLDWNEVAANLGAADAMIGRAFAL
jgi:iron(III) transport system substrate-binding protein